MQTHLLLLVSILFFSSASAQIINFPDANFKAKLLLASPSNGIASTETPFGLGFVGSYSTIDTNGDGEIQVSEALMIKYLDVQNSNISNLQGLNEFLNLEALYCNSNQISTLNVSNLTNLKRLSCDDNQISNLNVSGLTNLKILSCSYNQISNLNVSNLTNLQVLECSYNQLTLLNLQGLINLGRLVCESNLLTSLDLQGLINLQYLDCRDNQLDSIDVQGLTNLQYIYCFGNNLSSINAQGLTSLIELQCGNNQLTSLNLQGSINLFRLFCEYNQLTSLNLQGLTSLLDIKCNNNQLVSLDLQGLINLQYLFCENNQLTSLNLQGLINLFALNCDFNQLISLDLQGLTSLTDIRCINNQLTSLNLQGSTNLGRLVCESNLLTSLDLQGLINLQYLFCSFNQLASLDVQGLTNLQYLDCKDNQLTSLDLQNLINLQNIFCDDNQLTSLNIKNGIGFSNLYFNNNPNLQYICADESEIDLVQSIILNYGYSNCQINSYCSFTPGGVFYTIQGNNKFDGNSNGCDATDGFYPNLKYSISDGIISGSLISNTSGNYAIPVHAGTHTITPQFENPTYFTSSPTNATVSFPVSPSPFVQDFCILPNGVHHDLEVVIIPLFPALPGFDAIYKIKYKNKGTVSENATLVFNYSDSVLDYFSSTLAPTSTGVGVLSWNIGTVIPLQSGEFVVTLNVNSPMETPAVNAGDILSYTATINGLNTDETPIDNTFSLSQVVVNSFDPNDKTCLEGTTINPTMIGEYVHYKIRFENTGTFPAQNVVIKDMIDTTKFDISTLQITDTSHSCVTKITNPNKVEFIFENINLPFDDATNDGYIVFKIKTSSTLVVGSTINNLASIYFDYNFPIVTNTATSTFQALSNNTFNLDNYVSLSPNPAKDILNLNIQDETNIKSIAIYNMLGQLVQVTTSPTNSINISDLKAGNYIIKLHLEKGEIIRKFIKE